MALDSMHVEEVSGILYESDRYSPDVDREKANRDWIVRTQKAEMDASRKISHAEAVSMLAPKKAIDLKKELDPSIEESYPDLEGYVSLYSKASTLAKSIEESGKESLDAIRPLLGEVNLDDLSKTDTTVNESIKEALGIIALHQTLQLVYESSGQIKAEGVVAKYEKVVMSAKNDLLMLEDLAQKMPILTRPSRLVMVQDRWKDEDTSLEQLTESELSLSLAGKSRQLLSNLSQATDYSHIWEQNGLNSEVVETVKPSFKTIMYLVRYMGWYGLHDKEFEVEDWEIMKASFQKFGTKQLSQAENISLNSEIGIIENSLFEDVTD